MATYVLVSGSWLGGWAWSQTARRLREAGHEVVPVTLTGVGERVHLGSAEVDLDTHITDVVNVIAYRDLDEVVLVGHSYAGIVVEGVADRVPERLAHLIYLDSGPLASGSAHLDFYPPPVAEALRRQVAETGDGWRLPFPSFEELGAGASLAGLGDRERALMRSRATAQPFGTYVQPLHLTREYRGEYRRSVVVCTDGGFTAAQLRGMATSGDPRFTPLAAPDWEFAELHTGHWPMLSVPGELAGLLDRLVAGAGEPVSP